MLPEFVCNARQLARLMLVLSVIAGATTHAATGYVPSSPVGEIPGNFSVNGNGSATYNINIEVPPGTRGVTPSLSLSYDSHGGNGYLGMGWALNGISAITRCGANYKVDRYKAGVNFDDRDRFCLDGRRLIAVSGQYGADGTVYHTEQETWTIVQSQGVCGVGPCSFSATDKDGNTLSFGATTDAEGSRILAQGRTDGVVRTWNIDRFADLNGNATTVSYTSDTTTGEYYPTRIDYSSNAGAGLSAQRSIRFAYATRPDLVRRFLGGSQVQISLYLTTISTHVLVGSNDESILNYNIAYEQSPWTQRSRLKTLTLCDAADVCWPPSQFTWQTETASYQPQQFDLPGPTYVILNNELYAFGVLQDFNGDGIADYSKAAQFLTGSTPVDDLKVYLGQADGSFKDAGYSLPGPLYKVTAQSVVRSGVLQDINGDGILDYSAALRNEDAGSSDFTVYIGGESGFVQQPNYQLPGQLYWQVNGKTLETGVLVDMNGDGIADYSRASVLTATGQKLLQIYRGTGTGFIDTGSVLPGPIYQIHNQQSIESGIVRDINGDGIADFSPATVNEDSGQSALDVYLGQSPDFTFVQSFKLPGQLFWQVNGKVLDSGVLVDINGDGIADYSRATRIEATNQNLLDVHLGTGTGFTAAMFQLPGPIYSILDNLSYTQGLLTNWNQDGTTRYSRASEWVADSNKELAVYLGNGTGFVAAGYDLPKAVFKIISSGTYANAVYQDVNGDGLTDFVDAVCVIQGDGSLTNCTLGISLAAGPLSDLLSTITNGFSGKVAIDYASLTSAIYTSGAATTYPFRNASGAYHAVKGYTNDDGRGNAYSFIYTYAGARSDVQSYGWIGFESVTKTETANGRSAEMIYRQDYPFYGLIRSSNSRSSSGDTLAASVYSYTDIASAVNQQLGIHQPLRTHESITHYSDNTPAYSLEYAYEYDSFGNSAITSDLGDPTTDTDDVFTCVRYINMPPQGRLGYVEQSKVTRTHQACQAYIDATEPAQVLWDPSTDLRWSKTTYDSRMNVLSNSNYDNTQNAFLTDTYTVDAFGNVLSATSAANHTTTFVYDAVYHTFLTTTFTPELLGVHDTYQMFSTTVFEPGFGMLVSTTDANGVTKTQDIDGFGRPVAVYGPNPAKDPILLTTSVWTSNSGQFYLETRQRPKWSSSDTSDWYWNQDYMDGLGRDYLTRKNGLKGNAATVIETQMVYDDEGRIYQTSAPYFVGEPVPYTTIIYDVYNRPTEVTDPAGTIEKIDYAEGGLKISRTSAFGTADAQTAITYNTPRGLTRETVDPNGLSTLFKYSPMQEILNAKTTPEIRISTQTYDSLGRTLTSNQSDTGTTSWSFDTQGRLRTITDGAGYTVTYPKYDALERVRQRVESAGTNTTTINYTYDDTSVINGLGRMSQVEITQPVIGMSRYTYTAYDAYGQVTLGNATLAGAVYHYASEYDPLGRVTVATFPNGALASSTYLTDENLGTVSYQSSANEPATPYVSYSDYSALGQAQSMDYLPPSLTVKAGYFPVGPSYAQLKSHTVTGKNSTTLYSRDFLWNPLKSLTSVTDNLNPRSNENYGYQDQPLNKGMEFLSSAQGPFGTLAYDYDQIGNIKHKASVDFNYPGDSDRLTSTSTGEAFTYLGNGNLQTRVHNGVTSTYIYDAAGHMIQVDAASASGTKSGYSAYDHDGRLIFNQRLSEDKKTYFVTRHFEVTDLGNNNFQHTVYVPGVAHHVAAITLPGQGNTWVATPTENMAPPQKSSYLWPAEGIEASVKRAGFGWPLTLIAVNLLLLHRRSRRPEARFRIHQSHTSRFSFVAALVAVSVFVQSISPAIAALAPGSNGAGVPTVGTSFFVQDRLGNTVVVTDETGVTSASLQYLPYGMIDQSHSTGIDNFRPKFLSREWDPTISLYRLGLRAYDPELGRFVSPDPARQFKSPYVYGDNNPVTYVDPNGDFAFMAALIIGAIVGAYFGGAMVNHDFNPVHWNWSSGKTYAGVLGGAAIGSVGAAAGGLAVEAGVAIGAAGGTAAEVAGAAIGITSQTVIGAGENAAFTALGGGSSKEILEAAGQGALFGAAFEAGGQAVGAIAARFARQSGSELAEEVGGLSHRPEAEGGEEQTGAVCAMSFTPEVKVLKPDGQRVPIAQIQIGDKVVGHDLQQASNAAYTVTDIFSRKTDDLIDVVFETGGRLTVTPEHPFRLHRRGWVQARDLGTGTLVHQADDTALRVVSAERRRSETAVEVRNFTVDSAHNYFAGDDDVLVHNGKGLRVCKATYSNGVVTETWSRSELKRRYPNGGERQKIERDIRYKARSANKFMKNNSIKAMTTVGKKKVKTASLNWIRYEWKRRGLPGTAPKSVRSGLKILRPKYAFANQDVDEFLTRIQGGLTVREGYPDNQGALNSFVNQTSGAAAGGLARRGPPRQIFRFKVAFENNL